MRSPIHTRLLSIARREIGSAAAEDIVQDALVIAIEAGRYDLADADNARWLSGVVRNRARMAARSARRRRWREAEWNAARETAAEAGPSQPGEVLQGLPPALKALAALVLTGHNRREIAYLLHLPDTALRQRVSALKRRLVARNLAAPAELTGLTLDLAYGRIRDSLLPAVKRHGGVFASHDPDGHVFLVRRSQSAPSRQ